jgi:hypothetical protein
MTLFDHPVSGDSRNRRDTKQISGRGNAETMRSHGITRLFYGLADILRRLGFLSVALEVARLGWKLSREARR